LSGTAKQSEQAIQGASNIADGIRRELIQLGCRDEDISTQWLPDPGFVPAPESAELRVELAGGRSASANFSREELEDSRDRLDRQSVVSKINLVTEKLLDSV
jgi:hypothetical protein